MVYDVAAMDINGDGHLDVVTSNMVVYLGDGHGALREAISGSLSAWDMPGPVPPRSVMAAICSVMGIGASGGW